MKDDSIINLQNYSILVLLQNMRIFLIHPSKFLIPQNYLLSEKYSAILVSKKKNIYSSKEKIEGNSKYFILLMLRFIASQICFLQNCFLNEKYPPRWLLKRVSLSGIYSHPKYSVCRHSSSSNLYHRSIYHSPLPFSFKLLTANSTKRRAKESREARYKTASNGIKSRYLKDLHCLTSAATTFMTIFIVFLPRHYRVSSRLCSPTIKKATPKNLSTRGRA